MNHMYQAATGVALVASPECKTAVERANSVLAVAVRMRAALAQPTTIASGDPTSLDRAPADYREVIDRCPLRTPDDAESQLRREAKTMMLER